MTHKYSIAILKGDRETLEDSIIMLKHDGPAGLVLRGHLPKKEAIAFRQSLVQELSGSISVLEAAEAIIHKNPASGPHLPVPGPRIEMQGGTGELQGHTERTRTNE
jgi:hypothetical protein